MKPTCWTNIGCAALLAAACAPDIGAIDPGEGAELDEREEPELEAETDSAAITAADLVFTVRESAGVARAAEVVRSGVPLPRSLSVRATSGLAIVDSGGRLVPAEFKVLARWNAGRNVTTAPIQWLLVTFPASVAANGSATYRLVIDGSKGANPPPASSKLVRLSRAGDQVTVATGAATFVVSPHGLFQSAKTADGAQVLGAGPIEATISGRASKHTALRSVSVEHQGPLSAVVVVEGAYDAPAVGGGGIGSRRRYIFTSGSPTAIVEHAIAWEGDRCTAGERSCGGIPNGIKLTLARDRLTPAASATRKVKLLGARSGDLVTTSLASGTSAYVRQRLRAARTDPPRFELVAPGVSQAGTAADRALLSLSLGTRAIAVSLDHMHEMEPEALRVLGDGTIGIELASEKTWLGARQGIYARMAVSALSGDPTRAVLEQLTWAPLNAPLRAWPSARQFADSQAVGEIPVGTLATNVTGFDALLDQTLNRTLADRDSVGLGGVGTFGLFPRTWSASSPGEVDCSSDDPTPTERWDDKYWCATWTDYHNASSNASYRAMRNGQVKWFEEIAAPAARRVLYTQIFRCAPGDTTFYCGQAPAGYGGFRSDFNSSHAYFEGLMLYYWLTGDYTVVETIERGAKSMRGYLCSRRPASACLPTDPPTDPWAQVAGRPASQWYAAFRFVGLAGSDPTFLEDYRSGLARAVTQHYAEGVRSGLRYGFWTSTRVAPTGGTYSSDQLWMASLYDMTNLQRLSIDTLDAPIGEPAIAPSRVITSWARTLATFGPTTAGNGTAEGTWPNRLRFTVSGSRIGGTLGTVTADLSGSDPTLYDTGKANLVAVLLRGGQQSGDTKMKSLGARLSELTITAAKSDGGPLGKRQALFLSQLHAAVARITSGGTTTTVQPAPTPTTSPTTSPTILYTTADSLAAITSPSIGPSGQTTLLTSSDFVAGHLGTAARFRVAGARARYAFTQPRMLDVLRSGEIELWYQPSYAAASDDVAHTIAVIGDPYRPPVLVIEESDALTLKVIDASWNQDKVAAAWRAPLWTAGQWVRIRARFQAGTTDSLRIYVNNVRVDRGGARGVWSLGSGPPDPGLYIGARGSSGEASASGVIDEVNLRTPAQP
jgi:hypothetical protein